MPPQMRSYNGANDTPAPLSVATTAITMGRNQPKLAIPAGFRYLSITGVHDSPHLMLLSPSSMMPV